MKNRVLACAVAGALGVSGTLIAGPDQSNTGPFGFEPIPSSALGNGGDFNPLAPWILPEGFTQSVVSDEADLDIYLLPTTGANSNDWHDMNTVNETGAKPGCYLYRTHEVRGNTERGGTVSVVDLCGDAPTKVIAEDPTYDALDGIEWTPWGTVLFAEETTGGRLFEIVLDKADPMSGTAYDRPAVGRLAHEGIQVGPDGAVYVVDEFSGQIAGFGGGIYKFVPDRRGDLSSGDLYVLSVDTTDPEGLGQGSWAGPIDPLDARNAGTAAGGTSYNRPEDIEIIGNTLYVAVTSGTDTGSGQNYDGRVLAVDLQTLRVTDYVKPGVNVPVEIGTPGGGGQTGFDNPDNLAQTPDGKLIIIEDNVPSDIWIANHDLGGDGVADRVSLFASLTDPSAEGTGIYFGKDPKTMLVNVQHSDLDDGDATWAITKQD